MHASDQARFLEVIDEVESHGLSASRLIFKPLEGKLWEIKFSTPAAGYRVLYVMVEKDLDLARKRLKEVLLMKYKNITPARPYLDRKLKDKTIKIFFDEEKTKTEIARLVRAAREAAGFSQREIALKADTTQAVVARLELGTDKRMPSLMLIVRLLKAANAHLELKCIFDKVA